MKQGNRTYPPDGPPRRLTAREQQVFSLIGEGLTTKEIATALNLSPQTVSSYRRSICRKINVHTTVELMRRAMS